MGQEPGRRGAGKKGNEREGEARVPEDCTFLVWPFVRSETAGINGMRDSYEKGSEDDSPCPMKYRKEPWSRAVEESWELPKKASP